MGQRAILIVLSALPSLLEGELLPIRTYTTSEGLAADRINCILPDSRGFLWFCTQDGLSRFDGYHFVNYGVNEGLAHPAVTALIETRAGDYLVGTARGISRLNAAGQGARFTTYAPEREAAQNFVVALRESPSGKVWCATERSLFEWDRVAGFRRIPLPLPGRVEISSLLEDPSGDLLVGTEEGIYLLRENRAARIFTVKEGLPGDWVEKLWRDGKGRVWAALRGGLAMLIRRASGEWSLAKVYTDKSGLVTWDVKALLETSDGILWVGTMQGISRLKLGAREPVLLLNLTRANGLSDRRINALAQDQAGNIWVGTESAGVMRIDRLGFTAYHERDGLKTDRVFSVLEDRSGELLAVTLAEGNRGKSVNIFDGRRFHSINPKDYATWGWNQILLESRAGDWWAATKRGLCRYPPGKAADLDGREPRACYSPGGDQEVFRIFEDSRGGIWASAQSKQGNRLMRWDPGSGAITAFPQPQVTGAPSDDLVSAFAEDRHGNIWMGLYDGGLYRYDGRRFRYFHETDGMPIGLVEALLADEDGLWVATHRGGLGRIVNTADERPRVEIYNTARGLASDIILCLVQDRQGRIYAGTSKGVDRLDPMTGHIRHFSFAEGLPHGELTSAFRDRSGAFWFATKQGLARLIPEEDRPPVMPRVFITDLRIGGAPYPVSQLGETSISQLELEPSQNQLQVEFVGLDYEPGDLLRYSYKLEGADSDWSPPSNQLAVNYAALREGKYRFQVRAVTSEGVESASPAAIDFTVLPPLWRRWWFETLAAALVAALLFAGHWYHVTQAVALERIRTAIATDLHDDIGSSLSQIAVLSEVARRGVNGENRRTQESLQRVSALASEMVDSLSDIVWSIRAEPDGLDSLVSRMREFALDLLGGQGIAFELRSPPAGQSAQQMSLEVRRHLFLIFKECIHNAARHSGCSVVKAELKVVEREILLTVADNGRGLKPTEKSSGSNGGNGMPGMRRRAEAAGGSVQFASNPGEGCMVSIRLPLRLPAYLFR